MAIEWNLDLYESCDVYTWKGMSAAASEEPARSGILTRDST